MDVGRFDTRGSLAMAGYPVSVAVIMPGNPVHMPPVRANPIAVPVVVAVDPYLPARRLRFHFHGRERRQKRQNQTEKKHFHF
jgi:hypothetical protein